MTRKKIIIAVVATALVMTAIVAAWIKTASATNIAFVNYQPITLAEIDKANDNSFITLSALNPDDLDDLSKFDMVMVNGMGLHITDEQRRLLADAAESGTPVVTTAATNPDNYIVSVDSVDNEFIRQYLQGGRRGNYRSMLNYIRKYIDGKKFFINEIDDPREAPSGMFYHPDPRDTNGEMLYFNTLADYNRFLKEQRLLRPDAPRVILTGQMGVPDQLVAALESTGNVVYPVSNLQKALTTGVADSIAPSAVINMAHGRLGDAVVDYLRANNIPLFSPLNVNRDHDEWMADKMGMSGGFMSQSIVTPEIDGAIRPWALFAQYEGNDGVPQVKAIDGRLAEFVETVNNYIGLGHKPNSEKKVAIFYFKGPGQNALVAEGMEVGPSLYNLLKRLKQEGYRVDNLPSTAAELEKMIESRGRVFGSYAEGAMSQFVKQALPAIIKRADYDRWITKDLGKTMAAEIDAVDGEFPGHGPSTESGDLAMARLEFGNIVLIPQTAAGTGDDEFKMVHGTDMAPPHAYVASYLWARNGFKADALIHFGAHGSLEFTPRKQVAQSSRDWPDRLIGTLPHLYVYSTGNVGEAMIAKRRTYAGIVSYLTPPFIESNVRGIYKELSDAIDAYNTEAAAEAPRADRLATASKRVKSLTIKLGIHRELRLDSITSTPYTAGEIARIENFAEELANEKITGALYVMGVPYDRERLKSTVYAMTVDPIAYSLYSLDRRRAGGKGNLRDNGTAFTGQYLIPARALVTALLERGGVATDDDICRAARITPAELQQARKITDDLNSSKELFSKMMVMGSSMPAEAVTAKLSQRKESPGSGMKKMAAMANMSPDKAMAMARRMGADSAALARMGAAMKRGKSAPKSSATHSMAATPAYTADDVKKATAIMEIDRAIKNVTAYAAALSSSPESELSSIVNALSGGFISPTSGGDPVVNPLVLPTGRNMFAINAEETPTADAWEKGKALAQNTIKMYREAHNDSLPRKVSYTLWSSEFIETGGATIAQVLYMLGVEPVRDTFGRVTDLKLIPSTELGRPRIDVVVQTSGQLRDLAASRLFLINRAVEMASAATGDRYPNYVAEGIVESERHLVDKGVSPREARQMSGARVFGGTGGNYGTGITGLVEAGDRWDSDSLIAETYIANMGATYGSEEDWEQTRQHAFEAALTNTDVVVQPRQSNTWGALSLDHVYEFMGGMNLAVRHVTGKDPDAFMADYRNRNHAKMQEVKEAIGVESRTTILNPSFIKEKMKGGAGDASAIADVVRNTYGWNVMKPDVIDNQLWDDIYDTYIADRHHLGTKEFFTATNPAAIEEITAVMLETARKGMWKATDSQLSTLARLHTEVIDRYKPSCSGFVCDNPKLRQFIASKVDKATAGRYNRSIGEIRADDTGGADGLVMKQERLDSTAGTTTGRVTGGVVIGLVAVIVLVVILAMRRRHLKG